MTEFLNYASGLQYSGFTLSAGQAERLDSHLQRRPESKRIIFSGRSPSPLTFSLRKEKVSQKKRKRETSDPETEVIMIDQTRSQTKQKAVLLGDRQRVEHH